MKAKTFTISANLIFEMPVHAQTREEALVKFSRYYRNCVVQAIDDERPIAYCNRTGSPIFEDDSYTVDKKGNHILSQNNNESINPDRR